jgi:probable HAF family extracellular repeat protein
MLVSRGGWAPGGRRRFSGLLPSPRRWARLRAMALALLLGAGAACGDVIDPAGEAHELRVTADGSTEMLVGETVRLSVVVLDAQGRRIARTVRWETSDARVAKVDSAGVIVAEGSGTAEIRASAGGVSSTVQVRVRPQPLTVVGRSTNDVGQARAFVWTAADGMREIGTLGGGTSFALALNDRGHVVGYSQNASGFDRAFIWSARTGMRDLGTLGGPSSSATGINNNGQVVGSSTLTVTPGELGHAYLWTEQGGMRDLGTLGGASSGAFAISNAGQVVGHAQTASGQTRAFLWPSEQGMRDLGTLGGDESVATAIGESGQVVGYSKTASGQTHAFVWSDVTGMRDLGTLGGSYSAAYGISTAGIVGISTNAQGVERAFLYANGQMRDLGALPGADFSQAFSVNDRGEVVGVSLVGGKNVAFLWSPQSGMTSLGTLFGRESFARDVNNGSG